MACVLAMKKQRYIQSPPDREYQPIVADVILSLFSYPGDAPSPTNAHTLAEDLSTYQNMSCLVKSPPSTPEVELSAKEKRPLPEPRAAQPRIKTLAEQLNNLQVIESEAPTYHRHSLPPALPVKVVISTVFL